MTKINYIVADQVRVATFTNREDADLFWGVLQPLIKQGIITYAYIEDRCADLEDAARIVIEARDAERPLGETLANLAEVLERRP